MDLTYEKLLSKLTATCARSEQCTHDIRKKMTRWNVAEDLQQRVIDYLTQERYIDDERYARSYVHFHQEGKSKRRIQQDLMQKGIDRDVIALVLEEEYETSEEDMIRDLLRKKHYDPESADAKERSKMYRFLAGRGFSSGDISRVLRGYEDFS
jgi:regulatory protein